MKRELKRVRTLPDHQRPDSIAEPIPMKRELKRNARSAMDFSKYIAEPIPMKRELKLL